MSEGNGKELPRGWAWSSTSEIFEFVTSGSRGWSEYYSDVGPLFLRMGNLDHDTIRLDLNEIQRVSPPAGTEGMRTRVLPQDILVSITADVGMIGLVPDGIGEAYINQHVALARPVPNVNAAFVAWYLASRSHGKKNLRDLQRGATKVGLGLDDIRSIRLPLPPTGEQSRILDKLDELLSDLDAGAAALEGVRAKLKHYRAAVLKAAVEGALTAQWREQNPATESAADLLARIVVERRRRWEEAQLQKFKDQGKEPPKNWKARYKEPVNPKIEGVPSLPKGWCWATADQLCILINDGEHIQPPYQPTGFPMLTAKHVREGFVEFKNVELISKADFDACRKRCAPDEDDVLIVSVGATTGRAAIVGKCEPFAIVRSVLLLKPMYSPRFLLRWIQSPWCQTHIRRASGSSAQAHLYIADTKNIPVPLPPLVEQDKIVELVEDQLSVIDHLEADLEAKLKSAQALRQSILRDAFEGKLVPQDPNDEPASELLKRIAAEREERDKAAKAAKAAKKTVTKKNAKKRSSKTGS